MEQVSSEQLIGQVGELAPAGQDVAVRIRKRPRGTLAAARFPLLLVAPSGISSPSSAMSTTDTPSWPRAALLSTKIVPQA